MGFLLCYTIFFAMILLANHYCGLLRLMNFKIHFYQRSAFSYYILMLKNAKNLLLIKMNKTKLKWKFGRIYFPLLIFSITTVASSSTRLY